MPKPSTVRPSSSGTYLRRGAQIAFVLGLLACAPDKADPHPVAPTAVVGDTAMCATPTADAREYSEADLASAPQYRLDSEALFEVGVAEQGMEHDLSRVRHFVMASPTLAILATSAPPRVLWADASTRETHVVAASGEGPGQVQDIAGIVLRADGDSIGILDPMNARFSWFGRDRGLLASTSLVSESGMPLLFSTAVTLTGMLPGGRMIVSSARRIPSEPGVGGRSTWRSVARVDVIAVPDGHERPSGTHSLFLPNFDMALMTQENRDGSVTFPMPIRFSRSAFTGVLGENLVVSAPGGDGFMVCDESGTSLIAVHFTLPPRQVGQTMIDAVVRADSLQYQQPSREGMRNLAAIYAGLRKRPVSKHLPVIHRAFATGKVLWLIEAYAPTDASWSAMAFGVDGRLLGRLSEQPGAPPFAMDQDFAVFRDTREDGVVSFRVVRIQAPAN